MARMTKLCGRILSLTLAATTVLSSVPVASMTTYAAEESVYETETLDETSAPVVEDETSGETPEVLTEGDGNVGDGGETSAPVTGEDGETSEPTTGEEQPADPEEPGAGDTGNAEDEDAGIVDDGTSGDDGTGEANDGETEDAETGLTEDAETGLTEDAEAGLTEPVDETALLPDDAETDETKTYQLTFEEHGSVKGVYFKIDWYAPDDADGEDTTSYASVDTYAVDDAETDYAYKTYAIPEGYWVDLIVGCKTGATMALQKVTVNGEEQEVRELGANTGYVQLSTFTIKGVTEDTVIGLYYGAKHTSPIGTVLKNAADETVSVSQTSGNERIYAVTAGQEYSVYVTENGEALTDIVAEAWQDGALLEDVAINNMNGVASFRLGSSYAGKKIELRFYTSDKKYEVERISLQVGKRLTGITFKSGVTNGVLSQAIETTKTYTFTRTPSGTADEIGYYIKWVKDYEYLQYHLENLLEVSLDSAANQVMLTTGDIVTPEPYAWLVFYNKTAAEIDGIDTTVAANIPDEYILTAVQLQNTAAWTNNAPTVKFVSATNKEITFTITPPKGITDAKGGWYRIYIEDEFGSWIVDEWKQVDVTGTAALTCTYEVVDNEYKADYANDFTVTAQLVKTIDGENPDESELITAESKECTAVKMSTKPPYYATSISLKAIKSTLYSTNLYTKEKVAKVNFGANTADQNKKLADVTITGPVSYISDCWDVTWDDDGYIYISDAEGASDYFLMPGKYTLTATAVAQPYTEPATAKMTINVVAGIDTFDATSTTPTIYKKAGKSASASIKIAYYGYNERYAPKTKRFTYTYLDPETGAYSTDPSVLLGSYKNAKGKQVSYVTYSNGKVTIDKNYQLPEGEKSVSFTIRVKANDYAANEAYSDITFTVKAESSQLGGLVLIDSKTNKPVTVGKAGVSIGHFNGHEDSYILQGIVKGATVNADGTYDEADLIDPDEYKVTTNNRYVYMQNDMLPCINPGDSNSVLNKNVTFSAKSTDGTRAVRLTVKLVPETPVGEVNACLLSKAAVDESREEAVPALLAPVRLERGVTIDVADLSPEKGLIIRMDDEKSGEYDYGCLGEGYNYTLQVSGMTVTENGWYGIPYDTITYSKNQLLVGYMLGQKATITIKNGSKVVAKYNLVNSDYSSGNTVKLSGAKGSMIYYPYYKEQSMVYNAKNVPDTAVSVGVEPLSSSASYIVPATGTYDAETRQLTLGLDSYTRSSTNKYSVTFYDQDGNPVTRPVTITIKPIKMTTSFKLKTSYSGRNTDSTRIQLTGTAANVESVTFNSIRSINVKGQSNGFAQTFSIYTDGILRQNNPIKGLTNKTYKSLSGYVTYTVTYKNGKTETKTSKITVKVKGAPEYYDQK